MHHSLPIQWRSSALPGPCLHNMSPCRVVATIPTPRAYLVALLYFCIMHSKHLTATAPMDSADGEECFIVTQSLSHRNRDLLTSKGDLKPTLRRNTDYLIVPRSTWLSMAANYDVAIPTRDVYSVCIHFKCHGESKKRILVHGVEKVFDVILTLFVNKAFGVDAFQRMFVVKYCGEVIDPMVSFEWFSDKLPEERNADGEENREAGGQCKVAGQKEVLCRAENTNSVDSHRHGTNKADRTVCLLVERVRSNGQNGLRASASTGRRLSQGPDEYSTTESSTATEMYVEAAGHEGAVGLPNLGNTCFMNAAVQCVANCKELVRYFRICPSDINDDRLVLAWRRLLGAMATRTTIPMRAFKEAIGEVYGVYRGFDEQDSFEFITRLLGYLHEKLKKEGGKEHCEPPNGMSGGTKSMCNGNGIIEGSRSTQESREGSDEIKSNAKEESRPKGEDTEKNTKAGKDDLDSWESFMAKNNSIVSHLFYGLSTTTLTCSNCHHKRSTTDPFMTLSLPIPSETKTHPSIALVFSSSRLAMRITMPNNLTGGELCIRAAHRYGTKNLLAVEYAGSRIVGQIPSDRPIAEAKSIVLFEHSPGLSYHRCCLTMPRLYFFREKAGTDFLIPVSSSMAEIRLAIYKRLEPFLAASFSIAEFFLLVSFEWGPICPVFAAASINIHVPAPSRLFGSGLDSLVIPAEDNASVSLSACLDAFLREDVATLTCNSCNLLGPHSMLPSFTWLPHILIIQLKRFSYSRTGAKINSFIDFPLDGLVLAGRRYALLSTCNHVEIGRGYGHYMAYVRRQGQWYCCNDAVVSKASRIDKKNAYIFFYQSVS